MYIGNGCACFSMIFMLPAISGIFCRVDTDNVCFSLHIQVIRDLYVCVHIQTTMCMCMYNR